MTKINITRTNPPRPEDYLKALEKSLASKNSLFKNSKQFMLDVIHTVKVAYKYGFTTKTVSKIVGDNLKFRNDFDLSSEEYIIISLFAINPQKYLSSGQICESLRLPVNNNADVLKILFSLYTKDLLIINVENEIFFELSISFNNYMYSGLYKDTGNKPLRSVIRDIDLIANLYMDIDQNQKTATETIYKILTKYQDVYPFCKKMLEIQENTFFWSFIWYCICHMILNNSSISRDSDLVNEWVRRSNKEDLVNFIFTTNAAEITDKILDQGIDESGKSDKNSIEVHSEFKRKYLKGVIKEKSFDDVIYVKDISKKQLFFNKETREKADELYELISKKNFKNIKKRLKKEGLRTGFACLLSGVPGSGKTELCLQIAKKTGRNIMKVDMSTLRSKWWGEDEKNIKAVFSHYNEVVQESKIEPILLLNEADAIIGKRLSVDSSSNGAIVNSINAVQNIILEELENFEGILIATTNLTENFDSAFERRFIYKINFDKPDTEQRKNIWKTLAKIPDDWADTLSHQFNLSGGSIENIYRKITTKKVLYGNDITLEELAKLCKDENIKAEKQPVGFSMKKEQ